MMKLRVWSVTLGIFGISTAQLDDGTKGQVLWPLDMAVEPSEGRNARKSVKTL
jgi:hypothetical protein